MWPGTAETAGRTMGERTRKAPRALAVSAGVLLLLAGCSGGGQKKVAAPASTPASTGPTTTIRPVDTGFTGQNSASFCASARTYNDRFTKVSTTPSPEELRTVAREGQAAISQAVGLAPPEIK